VIDFRRDLTVFLPYLKQSLKRDATRQSKGNIHIIIADDISVRKMQTILEAGEDNLSLDIFKSIPSFFSFSWQVFHHRDDQPHLTARSEGNIV
jgi:hypothetical protein